MLAPCNDVHTFGMAELIDIAFLDEQGRVLESYRAVGPRRRISGAVKGGGRFRAVLRERPALVFGGERCGDDEKGMVWK